MSTIKFTNYKTTGSTVAGTVSNGINIYKQQFTKSTASATELEKKDITPILGRVITGTIVPLGSEGDDPLAQLEYVKIEESNLFKMPNNTGIVFHAIQGDESTKYHTYYIYFKDKDGNFWTIYLTNSDRAPLIFDVQDSRELLVTREITGTVDAPTYGRVLSVDTSNFVIKANNKTNGYATDNIELKNTTFNLATDEKKENKVKVIPFFCFKVTA